MALIQYSAGIDYVKGALAKPKKGRDGHKCGNYFIGTHREAPTTNPNCTRAYIRTAGSYERTTPLSTEEQAVRSRFTAISKGIAQRKANMETVAADLAAFKAQKDSANGYKTFRAYLWHVVSQTIGG